jgi:hypothetical protein
MLDISDLRSKLVHLKLTGELNRNTPEANRQAIRELLALNDYWALEAERWPVSQLSYPQVASLMANELGMTVERFESNEAPFIDPDHTASRLLTGLHRLETVALKHGKIMLATAHPGSLLSFYQILGEHLEVLGAQLVRLHEPVQAPDNRWLDEVNGVIVLSDEGNLMHTHASHGIKTLMHKTNPGMVMADHAFAVAAMNLGLPTVAIFDVDDPAVPVMAATDPDHMLGIPMNDNQTNTRTAQAADALIEVLNHERSSRHLHAGTASST